MSRDDFELSKMVRTQRSCSAVSGHHHGWEDVATGASKGVAMDGALLYCFHFLRKVETNVNR